MHPHIGHRPHPPSQVLIQSLVALPFQAAQGIPFGISHAVLHLPFGPGSEGLAGPGDHAPVPAEGFELRVELGPPAFASQHQRLCVVREDLLGHAAEVPEGVFQAHDPVPLAQASGDLDVAPAGETECRHEHVPFLPLAPD